MDKVEQFITDLLIKVLHHTAPNMTPDDDAKTTKTVQDFVTTALDLASLYFALRKSQSPKS